MTDEYERALRRAQTELAACDKEAEQLERKRAKLRQTVAILQSLVGGDTQIEPSLTEAILTVLKSSNDFMATAEILERLRMMGLNVQPASVATILSRLTKAGQLLNGIGVGGNGYMWVGNATAYEEGRKISRTLRRAMSPRPSIVSNEGAEEHSKLAEFGANIGPKWDKI